MRKWNRSLILLLILGLLVSVLGGCGKNEESFAPRKSPNGIGQKLYNDMMVVIDDAIKLQDDFNDNFSTYDDDDDDDEYHDDVSEWFDDLYEHELIEKYMEKEATLNEIESKLLYRTDTLYKGVLLFHSVKDRDLDEGSIERDRDWVNLGIEAVKEIIDIDIEEEDFIKK